MQNIISYEPRELSALRYALDQQLGAILHGSMDSLNPCFMTNARDMLYICIRALDDYMHCRGYIVRDGVYIRR